MTTDCQNEPGRVVTEEGDHLGWNGKIAWNETWEGLVWTVMVGYAEEKDVERPDKGTVSSRHTSMSHSLSHSLGPPFLQWKHAQDILLHSSFFIFFNYSFRLLHAALHGMTAPSNCTALSTHHCISTLTTTSECRQTRNKQSNLNE